MFASTNRTFQNSQRLYVALAAALIAALTLAASEPVAAQRFKEWEPKIDQRTANRKRLGVNNAFRDPAAFNEQLLKEYFVEFYFPEMTLESNAGELSKAREGLFNQFIRPAKVQKAQEFLTDLTFKAMQFISRDNYYPAARYNAVLILGTLDEKVAQMGAGAAPPVPLPAATNDLLELLEQNEFNGVAVPPSLKIAAMVGLERHARFGIDPQYADRLTKAALAVINQEEPPAELDADVHHWMQCQAAGVLVRQFAKSPNAQVQEALTRMIADGDLSLEDRCCVAGLLHDVEYEGANGIDAVATLTAIGDLMKTVAREEAKLARDFQQAILNPVRGNPRDGDTGPTYKRRRLISRITSIDKGANSLSKALPNGASQQVQNLHDALQPVVNVAADDDSLDLDITREVIALEGAVNSVVDSWQKPAEEAPQPATGEP